MVTPMCATAIGGTVRSARFYRNVRAALAGFFACLALILASFGLAAPVNAAGTPSTVSVGPSPQNVAVNPNTGHVFVTDRDTNNDGDAAGVSVFSDTSTPPTSSTKISGNGSNDFGSNGNVPWGVAVDTATNHVFVSNIQNHTGDGFGTTVTVIQDGDSLPTTQAGVVTGLDDPSAIAVNPTTKHVWVFGRDTIGHTGNRLYLIKDRDGSDIPTDVSGYVGLPAGADVLDIAVDTDTSWIYFADNSQQGCGCVYAFQDSDSINVNDLSLTKIPVGQPYDAVNDDLSDSLTGVEINPTTKHLAVSIESESAVAFIDIDPNSATFRQVISVVPVGDDGDPVWIAVNPLSNHVFVSDSSRENRVDVIQDSKSLPILPVFAHIPTSGEGVGIAVDQAAPNATNGAEHVIVANFDDASVNVFLDYGSSGSPSEPTRVTPGAVTATAGATSVDVAAFVESAAGANNPLNEGMVDYTLVDRNNQVFATSFGNSVGNGLSVARIAIPDGIVPGHFTILAGYHDGIDIGVADGTSNLNVAGTQVNSASVPFGSASVTLSATEIAGCTANSCTNADEGLMHFIVKQGNNQIGSAVESQVGSDGSASATFTIPPTASVGDYTIEAVYKDIAGTPGCTACTGAFSDDSGSGTLTITDAETAATVDDSLGIAIDGNAGTATFTATITNISANPAAPVNEGVVDFFVYDENNSQYVGDDVYAQVTNGTATANFTIPAGTPAGDYTIYAEYYDYEGADECQICNENLDDAEATGTLTITSTPAGTSMVVDKATTFYGASSASLSATISNISCTEGQTCPAVTEGLVTFTVLDGTTQLGQVSAQVSNGAASASVDIPTGTAVNSYTVNASYTDKAGTAGCDSCNGIFNDSSGSSTLEITTATTATTVMSNPSVPFGTASVTLSALVANTSATPNVPATEGLMTFTVSQGTTQIGSPLTAQVGNDGNASTSFTLPAGTVVGNYTITASYTDASGTVGCTTCSSSFGDSTNTGTLGVTATTTSTTVTSSPSVVYGVSSVELTAMIANTGDGSVAVVDEGNVTFTIESGTTQVGSVAGLVKNGSTSATFNIPESLSAGSYTVTASYHDDAGSFGDSASSGTANGTLTITQASTQAAITSNPLATVGESSTTLSASVTNTSCPDGVTCRAVAEGTLSFNVTNAAGTTVFTSDPLAVSDGSAGATMPLSDLPAGIYTVTASYGGTTSYGPSSDSGTLTIGYQLVALPGSTSSVPRGYYAVLRFAPRDADGNDIASRRLKVASVELDGPDGEVIPFVHQFQFGRFSGQGGYQLSLNTRNLSSGEWTVKLTLSNSTQLVYALTFTVE